MPREAYTDGGRRYDDEQEEEEHRYSIRNKDRCVIGERQSSSTRDYKERRGEDYKLRDARRDEPSSSLLSSQQVSRPRRRRSQSPDFERDRARDRQSYDRKYGDSRRKEEQDGEQIKDLAEPVFEASGLLAKESNNKNGVALKYAEPPEARKSKKKWRLYVFKDGKEIDVLHISRQSCYLLGRDRAVADIPIDHPSISKQHAVIQFRNIREKNEYGDEKQAVKPFLIDLDSANGCLINDSEVPPSRYYEMRNGDTLKLGGSQREYVLLAED